MAIQTRHLKARFLLRGLLISSILVADMVSRRSFWLLLIFILVTQSIPFGAALMRGADGLVFGGFVLNPIDGNSYLAKMQLGWMGEWEFRLLYSANSDGGALLFLFYILLGHLARLSGLPVVVVFHAARILASMALFFAIARFFGQVFGENQRMVGRAFLLAMVGGGLGVLVLLGGYLPADVWVAEGYPYLSMALNPHFPLGLALVLWLVQPEEGTLLARRPWLRLILGLLLSIVQPFGIVIVAVVLGVEAAWTWLEERKWNLGGLVWSMVLGGPWLVYQFWAIRSDPVLAQWDSQNLTPAPPLWDLVLSLSPALLLAALGGYRLWRERDLPGRRALIGWAVAGLVLIYLPFSLQRRFMTGIYVPMAGLAVFGAEWFLSLKKPRLKGLWPGLVVASVLTNIMMLLITTMGVVGKDTSKLFLTTAERDAFLWLRSETAKDAVVLLSPEFGMFVPAWTGRRTVYGHPFETINAAEEEQLLTQYLSGEMGDMDSKAYLRERQVAYVVLGPREGALGVPDDINSHVLVYDVDGVKIYSVSP